MATTREDEQLTARLSSGTIHYREYGGGEPILFVHGLLANGKLWRKVVPFLSPGYRCIVPDLPLGSHKTPMNDGADLSPRGLAALIAEFVASLGIESVVVVGNDTGGALSQIVAAEYPERVTRLVLTNCDCFERFPPPMFVPLLYAARVPGFLYVIAQTMRSDAIRRSPMAYGWLTKRPIDAAVLDEWLRPLMTSADIRRDVGVLLRAISPRFTQEAAEKLRAFERPVLIAWAPEDRVFPYGHAKRLAELLPNARLEPIEDSLAFVPEDQPERLAQLISGFLQERSTSKAVPSD